MRKSIEKIVHNQLSAVERTYFNSLLKVHAGTLSSMRDLLALHQFVEVSEHSLYPLTGLRKNMFGLFPDELSQPAAVLYASAQLQLDALALELGKNCFVISRSFENRPSMYSRVSSTSELGELTLVELLAMYGNSEVSSAFEKLLSMAENLVQFAFSELLNSNRSELFSINSDLEKLYALSRKAFVRLSYEEACEIIDSRPPCFSKEHLEQLFRSFAFSPIFITHFPRRSRLFNVQGCSDDTATFSFDLYLPKVGYVLSGALQQESKADLQAAFFDQLQNTVGRNDSREAVQSFERYCMALDTMQQKTRGYIGIDFEQLLGAVIPRLQEPVSSPRIPFARLKRQGVFNRRSRQ